MLIKQWKRIRKARKAIYQRAKVWSNLEPLSAVLGRYNKNAVIHHIGRAY